MNYPIALGKGIFECVQCGYTGKRTSRIKEHVQKLGPLHNDECAQCSQKMTSFNEYKDHVNNQHFGVWKFKCGFENCGKIFEKDIECKRHIREVHRQHELKPREEWKSYPKKKPTDELIGICDICGYNYKTRRDYSYHMHSKHTSKDLKKKCPYCNSTGHRVLKQHIEQVHLEKMCPQCGKMIIGTHRLNRHIKSVHIAMEDRPFKCKTCGKGFNVKTTLDEHYNIHTGAKPFKCKYCPSAFASKGNLAMHERATHLGIKRKSKS